MGTIDDYRLSYSLSATGLQSETEKMKIPYIVSVLTESFMYSATKDLGCDSFEHAAEHCHLLGNRRQEFRNILAQFLNPSLRVGTFVADFTPMFNSQTPHHWGVTGCQLKFQSSEDLLVLIYVNLRPFLSGSHAEVLYPKIESHRPKLDLPMTFASVRESLFDESRAIALVKCHAIAKTLDGGRINVKEIIPGISAFDLGQTYEKQFGFAVYETILTQHRKLPSNIGLLIQGESAVGFTITSTDGREPSQDRRMIALERTPSGMVGGERKVSIVDPVDMVDGYLKVQGTRAMRELVGLRGQSDFEKHFVNNKEACTKFLELLVAGKLK